MDLTLNKPWEQGAQGKNDAWFLPRPKKNKYPGGIPLHAEEWITKMAMHLYGEKIKEKYILQPFGGAGKYGLILDIKDEANPDLIADAHNLPFKDKIFKVVFCDPPYSNKEAKEIYGTPPLSYKDWSQEAERVLQNKGILILYHKHILPNPNPKVLSLKKRVFLGNRVYHTPRVIQFYQKN